MKLLNGELSDRSDENMTPDVKFVNPVPAVKKKSEYKEKPVKPYVPKNPSDYWPCGKKRPSAIPLETLEPDMTQIYKAL